MTDKSITVSTVLSSIDWSALKTGLPELISDTSIIIQTNQVQNRIDILGNFLSNLDKQQINQSTKNNIESSLRDIVNSIKDNDIRTDLNAIISNVTNSYCNLCLATQEEDIQKYADQIANYVAGIQHIETRLKYRIHNQVCDAIQTALILALQVAVSTAVVVLL